MLRTVYVLKARSPQERKNRLRSLPKGLNDAYERLLKRMEENEEENEEIGFKVFSWLVYGQRLLSMRELQEALYVQLDDTPELIEKMLIKPKDILEACRGLVIWEKSNDTVRFTHQTAEIYLKEKHLPQLQTQQVGLALSCLHYLAFNVFDHLCGTSVYAMKKLHANRYKFMLYAAQFWGIHTRGESEKYPEVQQIVLSLLASENKRNSMLAMGGYASSGGHYITMYNKRQTLLHVVAGMGLTTICSRVLEVKLNDTVYVSSIAT
jgi:hypothetical protein